MKSNLSNSDRWKKDLRNLLNKYVHDIRVHSKKKRFLLNVPKTFGRYKKTYKEVELSKETIKNLENLKFFPLGHSGETFTTKPS